MAAAKSGDKVKVHYTGKLADGSVFDSSDGREPLEFTIGDGSVIPDFDAAVEGLSAGESVTREIEAESAYGKYIDELVMEIDRGQLPQEIPYEVGRQLQVPQEDGRAAVVTITNVTDSSVTLDANHPLAGKDLTFQIELVEIVGA